MCPSVGLRLTLKFEHSSDLTRLVCDVLDDDGSWRRVTAEHLPSSSALSRVRSLCALARAVAHEELAEPSTAAT
jgi:hypothetical protein